MKNIDQLLDGYVQECRARGITEETVLGRQREVNHLIIWLKSRRPRKNFETIGSQEITEFLKTRATFKAKSTVYGVMSNLRCFGDYLSREGAWKKNVLKWMPGPKILINSHVPKSLKRREIESLLTESFKQKERLHQYLWPAAILCLYTLGLRRGELLRLNLCDWDQKAKTLKIKNTKSGFERYVPVPLSLERSLEAYLQIRLQVVARAKKPDESALFLNKLGKRIEGTTVSVGIKKIALRAGIESFSLHQLRHSCATHLLEAGVKLPQVKMVLGHACIETTMRYTQVSGPERRKAINLHPINKMLEASI